MRYLVTLALSGMLAIGGCADDSSSSLNPKSDCLTTGAGDGGVNPSSPVVTNVAWDALGFCQVGARNNYNIFVFASDIDSEDLELTFDVSVPDCSPVANLGNVFVVNCPNTRPHSGAACAEDPDGNVSSRVEFTFQVCETGDCGESPDACDMLALDPP
jgi:hypothetical protein